MSTSKLLIAAVAATVGMSSLALASRDSDHDTRASASEATRATVPSFGVVQAIALAQTYTKGVAFDAHSHRIDPDKTAAGGPRAGVYDVRVFKDGRLSEVRIDGRTGELLAAW